MEVEVQLTEEWREMQWLFFNVYKNSVTLNLWLADLSIYTAI